MNQTLSTTGLRHLALFVTDFENTLEFYTRLLGMQVEWHPDEDNIYLTSGNDNLALHRAKADVDYGGGQRLDHLGFGIPTAEAVDDWYTFLRDQGVKMHSQPKTHRDGARSFYCADPDGNVVQLIFHPPLTR